MPAKHGEEGRPRSPSGGAIGVIAALGMVAAPTASSIAASRSAPAEPEIRCASRSVDVERRFGGEADVVTRLRRGAKVEVLDARDDQTHVRYKLDGQKHVGWVATQSLGACAPPREPASSGTATSTTASDVPQAPNHADTLTTAPLGAGEMRAHYIDIGQGVSTLYEFSCGAALIDTGGESTKEFESNTALKTYLDAFFAGRPELHKTLDLLVISHPHADHTHGAETVTTNYKVKNVVTDGLTRKPSNGHLYSGGSDQEKLEAWAQTSAKLETVSVKDIPKGGKTDAVIDPIACGDVDPKFRALWGSSDSPQQGWNSETFNEANNHSVAIRLDFGKASFLTTGDLEIDAIPALIALQGSSHALDVGVWEVSHHGSANGTSDELLDAITPELALLGTGDPARSKYSFTAFGYGHPRKTIIEELERHITRTRPEVEVLVATHPTDFEELKLDKAIYATGWDGAVVVTASKDGTYRVEASK